MIGIYIAYIVFQLTDTSYIEMMKQSSKLQTLQEIKELVDEYITFSKYNYVNIINALQDCWTEEQ
jgi:hypothetical protein